MHLNEGHPALAALDASRAGGCLAGPRPGVPAFGLAEQQRTALLTAVAAAASLAFGYWLAALLSVVAALFAGLAARLADEHAALIEPILGRIVGYDEKFAAENGALWTDGLLLHVPAGVKVELPFHAAYELATPEAALRQLAEDDVVTTPCRHAPDGLAVVSGHPFRAVAEGAVVVQDEASQLVPLGVHAVPGPAARPCSAGVLPA